jgi:hypothetical protein
VALVKYMQYVSSRQEIIKYLYSDKLSGAGTAASPAEANDEQADKLSGTVILDSQVSSSYREPMSNDFERLPKGEAMMIHLEQGRTADIMLSKHKCGLASRNGLFFIDQSGHRHALMKGKNVIGRDASSTVKIDSSLRDVSRLHLIIENKGDNILQLTDLSSHGTFVTPAVLSPQMA